MNESIPELKATVKPDKPVSKKWRDKGVVEMGDSEFGKSYKGLKGKDAEDFLIEQQGGEVLGAYETMDGKLIDLIRGKTNAETNGRGYGLSKIIEKHPDVLGKIDDIIKSKKGVTDKNGLMIIDNGTSRVVIMPHWKGNQKRWVLSAYNKN